MWVLLKFLIRLPLVLLKLVLGSYGIARLEKDDDRVQ
jgi:hypothetical protein